MLKFVTILSLVEVVWLIYIGIYKAMFPKLYENSRKKVSVMIVVPGLILIALPLLWLITILLILME